MEHSNIIQELAHQYPELTIAGIWCVNIIMVIVHILNMSLPDELLWGLHITGVTIGIWASVEVIMTNRKKRKDGHN